MVGGSFENLSVGRWSVGWWVGGEPVNGSVAGGLPVVGGFVIRRVNMQAEPMAMLKVILVISLFLLDKIPKYCNSTIRIALHYLKSATQGAKTIYGVKVR